jgi:hypothetical protein
VVVATPGRLADQLENNLSFKLDRVKYLVMDEADRLLEGDGNGRGPVVKGAHAGDFLVRVSYTLIACRTDVFSSKVLSSAVLRIRIRIHRIHMFLASRIRIFLSSCKNSKENLDSYYYMIL